MGCFQYKYSGNSGWDYFAFVPWMVFLNSPRVKLNAPVVKEYFSAPGLLFLQGLHTGTNTSRVTKNALHLNVLPFFPHRRQ